MKQIYALFKTKKKEEKKKKGKRETRGIRVDFCIVNML